MLDDSGFELESGVGHEGMKKDLQERIETLNAGIVDTLAGILNLNESSPCSPTPSRSSTGFNPSTLPLAMESCLEGPFPRLK